MVYFYLCWYMIDVQYPKGSIKAVEDYMFHTFIALGTQYGYDGNFSA